MTDTVNVMTDVALLAGSAIEAAVASRIAANLLSARRLKGLSQDQLASRSGVSKGTIVQIEQGRGNPNVGSLCRLAVALSSTLEGLVSEGEVAVRVLAEADAKLLWQGSRGGSARLLIGAPGSDMLELWSWELAEGERYESEGHSPGSQEILRVTKGVLRLDTAGRTWTVAAGSSTVFDAANSHVYIGADAQMTSFTMVVHEPRYAGR